MEWEQDDSIDIPDIKRIIFGASIPSLEKSNAASQPGASDSSQLDVGQNIADRHIDSASLSNGTADRGRAHHTSTVNGSDKAIFAKSPSSPSQLPSTVPDSRELHPTQISNISPELRPAQTKSAKARAMNNPENDLDDTQPLSQSVYETFVSKSVIEPGPRQKDNLAGRVEHNSIQEQESDHIDILSGFKNGDEHADEQDAGDDVTSEIYNFSPTQLSAPLPRLPDSQRFKTPATAGKKRDFMGQTVDKMPAYHNPFASANKTPAPVMGLSQLFQTTQAVSSPLMLVPSDPSDRPSPNLETSDRPNTATSPLVSIKPHSRFQRASTEPSANYVSMKHSQAERRKDAEHRNHREDESDDGFDDEPSLLEQQRQERERDRRFKEQSDAIMGLKIFPQSHDRSPIVVPDNDSEEETDYDEISSRKMETKTPRAETEEDKENIEMPIQVPRTTMKLQEALLISDSSPLSTRNTWQQADEVSHSQPTTQRRGIGSFAIADSQRSVGDNEGLNRRDMRTSQHATSSAGEVIIPQSQPRTREYPIKPPVAVNGINHKRMIAPEMRVDPVISQADAAIRDAVDVTGPDWNASGEQLSKEHQETDTVEQAERDGGTTKVHQQQTSTSSQDKSANGQSNGSTKFDTAQSELPPVNNSTGSSSQQSVQSPQNRPMKKMADIAEEPSPQRSSNLTEFVPDILTADDKHFMQAIEGSSPPSSPIRAGRRIKKRRIMDSSPASSPVMGSKAAKPLPEIPQISMITESVRMTTNIPRPDSVRTRKPVLKSRESNGNGIWDLPESPPKRSATIHRKRKRSPVEDDVDRPRTTSPCAPTDPIARLRSEVEIPSKVFPAQQAEDAHLSDNAPNQANPQLEQEQPVVLRPNQIFACFNGKSRAYYPARCLGVANLDPLRYRIQWDGFAPDEIDAHGIKRLELRVGDTVKISLDGFPKAPHTVQGFKDKIEADGAAAGEAEDGEAITDIFGHRAILIAPKQRKSLPKNTTPSGRSRSVEVPIANVYLDSNMWSHFKDRDFSFTRLSFQHPLATKTVIGQSSGFITPADRPTTPISPPSRTRRNTDYFPMTNPITSTARSSSPDTVSNLFATMLFALSIDEPARKSDLVHLIRSHSGNILDDGFDALFTSPPKPSSYHSPNKDRSPAAETLNLIPTLTSSTDEPNRITFVALITPDFSRKTKYMQALSLGIPCLSPAWLTTCTSLNRLVPWSPYLLAAGKSLFLDGATKSRILPAATGNLPFNAAADLDLTTMLAQRPLPLSPSTAAVLGVVFVMGRSKPDERRGAPYLFLLRAMGASIVTRVFDVAAAAQAVADLAAAAPNRTNAAHDEQSTILVVIVDERELERARVLVDDHHGGGGGGGGEDGGGGTKSGEVVEGKKSKAKKTETTKNKHRRRARHDDDDDHPNLKVDVVGTDFVAQTCIMGQLPAC